MQLWLFAPVELVPGPPAALVESRAEEPAPAPEPPPLPRPRTRGECVDGPRPCPWVSCRHHLLLDISVPVVRPPSLVLARADRARLSEYAAASLVRAWINDAAAELDRMPETCALDVADRGAMASERVAELIGVSRQRVDQIGADGLAKLRESLSA